MNFGSNGIPTIERNPEKGEANASAGLSKMQSCSSINTKVESYLGGSTFFGVAPHVLVLKLTSHPFRRSNCVKQKSRAPSRRVAFVATVSAVQGVLKTAEG